MFGLLAFVGKVTAAVFLVRQGHRLSSSPPLRCAKVSLLLNEPNELSNSKIMQSVADAFEIIRPPMTMLLGSFALACSYLACRKNSRLICTSAQRPVENPLPRPRIRCRIQFFRLVCSRLAVFQILVSREYLVRRPVRLKICPWDNGYVTGIESQGPRLVCARHGRLQ